MKRSAVFVAISLLMCSTAEAVVRDSDSVPGLMLIRITPADTPEDIRPILSNLVETGEPFGVLGNAGVLRSAMPDDIHAWPATEAWVIDPREGLGVYGIGAVDDQGVVDAFATWFDTYGASSDAPPGQRAERATFTASGSRAVALEFTSNTPATICRSFNREMYATLFGSRTPSPVEKAAFRAEVRRWCQYGVLSRYSAARPTVVIEPFRDEPNALLSISTEWALIRSEDRSMRNNISYSMWVKTVGEGSGFGFTRRSGSEAMLSAEGLINGLFDVAIHMGWGGLASWDTVTAWPFRPSFPYGDNVLAFECDGLDGYLRSDCPVGSIVRKLYPEDSYDDSVSVAMSSRFEMTGSAQMQWNGKGTERTPKVVFGLSVMNGETDTTASRVLMSHIRSNADTEFHRTTRWSPDLHALYRWILSRGTTNMLGKVLTRSTPLASTLNPRYEILWEIPLDGNEGRVVPYHAIYEMGWNTCDTFGECVDWRAKPKKGAKGKARMAWHDSVMLRFPSK